MEFVFNKHDVERNAQPHSTEDSIASRTFTDNSPIIMTVTDRVATGVEEPLASEPSQNELTDRQVRLRERDREYRERLMGNPEAYYGNIIQPEVRVAANHHIPPNVPVHLHMNTVDRSENAIELTPGRVEGLSQELARQRCEDRPVRDLPEMQVTPSQNRGIDDGYTLDEVKERVFGTDPINKITNDIKLALRYGQRPCCATCKTWDRTHGKCSGFPGHQTCTTNANRMETVVKLFPTYPHFYCLAWSFNYRGR